MFRKWKQDLKRIHDDQLFDLLLNREIFRQVGTATSKYVGTYQGAELAGWMQQNYVAFAGTAIRRLLERPKGPSVAQRCPNCGFLRSSMSLKSQRSISLVILLRELQQYSHVFTRAWFCSKYKGMASSISNRDFDLITRNKRAGNLTADRIERDIAVLERVADPVRRLVNKAIAHTEKDRRRIGRPKYSQIDAAIDEIFRTFARYRLLIEQRSSDLSGLGELVNVRYEVSKIWP